MSVRQRLIVFLVYFRCRATHGSSAESSGDGERGRVPGHHRRVLRPAELHEGSLDIGGACVYAGRTLPRRGSSPRNRGKFACLVSNARVPVRFHMVSLFARKHP